MTAKLTFDEALERIGDQRSVSRDDVRADALRRKVWVAEWHFPGCLSDGHSVCLTKDAAIAEACTMAETGEDGAPRGMATALRRSGRFVSNGIVNTVQRLTLADLL